jgi:putative ABC transport system permease protein
VWTPVVPELAAIAASIALLPPDGGNVGVLYVLGRLTTGATVASARLDLNRVIAQRPRRGGDRRVEANVRSLVDDLLGSSRVGVLAVFAAVVLLLLVVCANVAGLLLTRASQRAHEFAVRAALGATRGTLVRQVLVETLLLSAAATLVAVPLAASLLPATIAFWPADVPRLTEAALNARALGFTVLAGIAAALMSAAIPAAHVSSHDVESVLRRNGPALLQPGLRHPVRRVLIAGELAAAVALLTAAALLILSVWRLRHLDVGFEPSGLLAIEMGMPSEHIADADQRLLLQRGLDGISRIPGVRSASGVSLRPLLGPVGLDSPYDLEGQSLEAAAGNPYVNTETITPSYFQTMKTRLLAGRPFDDHDRAGSAPVLIVSAQFAAQAWPGQSPLGKRLHVVALDRTGSDAHTLWTVVGVADDIRYRSLEARGVTVYAPAAQSPDRSNHFVVRADVLDGRLIARIRETVRAVNDNSTVRLDLMDDVLAAMERPWHATLALFGLFALATAAIACLGLYGMVTHTVVAQQREIGVRLVLGANPGRLVREVLAESASTIAIGLAAGVALAATGTPLMRSVLFDVKPTDPLAFSAAPLLFGAVALLATAIPARRAATVDPAACLRAE